MAETALARAHAAMQASDDDTSRLRFYQEIADAELFLLLDHEPVGSDIKPQIFDLEAGRFAMVFDLEDRLAAFSGKPAPYAALPGRIIAAALTGQETGLALNLGVATSGFLMPPEALRWLTQMLGQMPVRTAARAVGFKPPTGLPQTLVDALAMRLARFAGLARRALLAEVSYADGRKGHMLAVEGAQEMAQAALAKAVSESLIFSGTEAIELDVAFLAQNDPGLAALRQAAITIPIPDIATQPTRHAAPKAPGMDPTRPPKLR